MSNVRRSSLIEEVTSKPLDAGLVWAKDASSTPILASPEPEALDIDLLFTFQSGCFSGGQMTSASFENFCHATMIETEAVTQYLTHRAFCDVRLQGGKTINFHQFQGALRQLAPLRYPDSDAAEAYALTRKLALGYDPAAAPPVRQKSAASAKPKPRARRRRNTVAGVRKVEDTITRAETLEADARAMFAKYDTNNNNHIDMKELRQLLGDFGFEEKEVSAEVEAALVGEHDERGIPFDDFVVYYNRLQARRRGREAFEDAASAPEKVKEAFFSFCTFGASRTETDTLDMAQFNKLCRDCHLVGKNCPPAEIDVVFETMRPTNRRVMPFPEFESALRMLAAKLYVGEDKDVALNNVYELIVGTGKPVAAVATGKGPLPGVFSSLHDTSNYTGVQRYCAARAVGAPAGRPSTAGSTSSTASARSSRSARSTKSSRSSK